MRYSIVISLNGQSIRKVIPSEQIRSTRTLTYGARFTLSNLSQDYGCMVLPCREMPMGPKKAKDPKSRVALVRIVNDSQLLPELAPVY